MIIFVHMLKAGGTTLRRVLEATYGDRLIRDYDDIPMSNRPEHATQRVARLASLRLSAQSLHGDIVFGHFVMGKYRNLRPDLQFATMVRDPAERIVSHYFHYLRHIGGPRNEILPEGITLLEFSRLPKYCDMYRYLLGGVPVDELAYIGIMEEFAASVELFYRVFDVKPKGREAVGPFPRMNHASEYGTAREYLVRNDLLEAVRASQAVNYEVYAEARERFQFLCDIHGVNRRLFS